MPSFSQKPSSRNYKIRSITLPVRSHRTTQRTDQELHKLKASEAITLSSPKASQICNALYGLGDLYKCLEDLLSLPLTRQALAQHQEEELLDDSLRYLDFCGNTREAVSVMKEGVRELKSAIRRRKVGDSSIESSVTAYMSLRKKMKKGIEQSFKQILDHKYGGFPLDHLDSHLCAVVRVLREVEHVIREQNVLAANEFIELFCELIVSRLSIIAKRRECPADLKEGIASLIFAAPRCSEIPELVAIRDVFEKKYGKDFVSAATDLRPNCGVNRMLIDKLSVRTPTGEFKLKIMKEIAKEYQVNWDTTETEKELLKPPEELIEGPRTFVSATSLPVKPVPNQSVDLNTNKLTTSSSLPRTTTSGDDGSHMYFQDSAGAAKAAAKCANEAIAAAKAAAFLANKDLNRTSSQPPPSFDNNNPNNNPSINIGYEEINHQNNKASGRAFESQNFNGLHSPSNVETLMNNNNNKDSGRTHRRHSYNAPSAHSDIKFDESDCDEEDEEIEAETPPNGSTCFQPPQRAPPPVPLKQDSPHSVHPKLPDYDSLAARFEALKYRRNSQP